MTILIEFPQPAKLLTLNQRDHWSTKAKIAAQWRLAAFYATSNLVNQGKVARNQPKSNIHVTLPVSTVRRRDAHNFSSTLKPVIDGMVDAGLFSDDSIDHVVVSDPSFHRAKVCLVAITPTD